MNGIKPQDIATWAALALSLLALVWNAAQQSSRIDDQGKRLDRIEISTLQDSRAIVAMQRDLSFLADRARREDDR